MASAIILAREYWKVSSFEHYIRPVFENSNIVIEDIHGFSNQGHDQILLALRLEESELEARIYDAIKSSISVIEEDNKANEFKWSSSISSVPGWRAHPILMDKTPELIGKYKGDDTASQLFPSVALGYIAKASGSVITELVKNSSRQLNNLGQALSNL